MSTPTTVSTTHESKVEREHVESALLYYIKDENVSNPGAQRLRSYIGFGNIGRIQRLKEEIKAEWKAERLGLDHYPLSDSITKAAHSLYVELMNEVDKAQVEREIEVLKELKELKKEFDTLETAHRETTANQARLLDENSQLQTRYTETESNLNTALNNLAESDKKVASLTKAIRDIESRSAKTEDDLRARITELSSHQERLEAANTRETKSLRQQLTKQETGFKAEINKLQRQVTDAQQDLATEKNAHSDTEKTLRDTITQLLDVQKENKTLNESQKLAQDKLNTLTEKAQLLEVDVNHATKQYELEQTKSESQEKLIASLENINNNQAAEVKQLTKQLKTKKE